MGVLCTWVKLLTDLQISGCELHKHAFGGRARPGPANRYKAERKGREGLGGGGRKGKKGHEGVGRDGKGKGRIGRGSEGKGKERNGSTWIFVEGMPSYASVSVDTHRPLNICQSMRVCVRERACRSTSAVAAVVRSIKIL